jgi:hypothetical protein
MAMIEPCRTIARRFSFAIIFALVLASSSMGQDVNDRTLSCATFQLSFDAKGRPASLRWRPSGKELLDAGNPGEGFTVAPLNRNGSVAGKSIPMPTVDFPSKGKMIVASADGSRVVTFAVQERERHLAFRIVDLKGFPTEETVLLSFSFKTNVRGVVGQAISTVRGEDAAVGVQSLDYMTTSHISGGNPTELRVEWGTLWHRNAEDPFGGFALFVCPSAETLDTIGKIELAEGLPHPMHNGKWAKVSNGVSRLSQMWFVFNPRDKAETNKALGYFQAAGMRLFYLPQWVWQGPGFYQVKTDMWPKGIESLRAFSDRLRSMGILLGIHTGSAGAFMRDPILCSPKIHDDMAIWGRGELEAPIAANDATILWRPAVGTLAPIRNENHSKCTRPPVYPMHWSTDWFRIGDEMVQVGELKDTDKPVWTLVKCRRGSNGTKAVAHAAKTDVRGMLVTYGCCFAPDVNSVLFKEATDNMAKLVNGARLARISYDALEMSDFLGYWGSNKFMLKSYEKFNDAVACESSNGVPQFQWHMASYQNVGEGMHMLPKNYFEGYLANNCKNSNECFLPGALGAFTFRTADKSHLASTPDEWQWLLAKAAGYDACFFFETAMEFFRKNGQTDEILQLCKAWENARIAHAFTDEQRAMMRDYDMSFRLDTSGKRWSIYPVKEQIRYGIANGLCVVVENPFAAQPLRFEARVLPAFNYAGAKNIPLLPADLRKLKIHSQLTIQSIDGSRIAGIRGDNVKAQPGKEVSIEDYLTIMGTGTTGLGKSGDDNVAAATAGAAEIADHTLLLSTRNSGNRASGQVQAEWSPDKPIDLSAHRGVGMWVTGDGNGGFLYVEISSGMVRKYMVPNDRKGRRYIEIPCGEIGSNYHELWDNGWHAIKLGFNYGKIRKIAMGLTRVPSGAEVRMVVESPRALAEIEAPLVNPVLHMNSATLAVNGSIKTGEYLSYDGGANATVRDENRRLLRTVVVKLLNWTMPKGTAELRIAAAGSSPNLRLQFMPVGTPFTIADPTEKAQQVYKEIIK